MKKNEERLVLQGISELHEKLLNLHFTLYNKRNSKNIKYLIISFETIKVPEEHARELHYNHDLKS